MEYPVSESLTIGRVIRLIGKGQLTEAVSILRELQEQAAKGHHRNPPIRARRRMHRHFESEIVDIMSQEVHAILYRHSADGKQYRHDFINPTSMMALRNERGRSDILITSPDGFPIWQEF